MSKIPKTYNPEDVKVTFGGREITGIADGAEFHIPSKHEKWRELAEKAYPGPWHSEGGDWIVAYDPNVILGSTEDEADTAFIVAAREAVPALLDEVMELRRRLAKFEGKVDEEADKLTFDSLSDTPSSYFDVEVQLAAMKRMKEQQDEIRKLVDEKKEKLC